MSRISSASLCKDGSSTLRSTPDQGLRRRGAAAVSIRCFRSCILGEAVLADFPYSDHTVSKVRPALVVQADAWNQRLDDTILALIPAVGIAELELPPSWSLT